MAKKKVTKPKKGKGKIEIDFDCDDACNCHKHKCKSSGGCLYFLGFIGSAIYFVSNATSFWSGVWGVLKSFAWPAFLVYEALKYLLG
jgi:hypothetical protein